MIEIVVQYNGEAMPLVLERGTTIEELKGIFATQKSLDPNTLTVSFNRRVLFNHMTLAGIDAKNGDVFVISHPPLKRASARIALTLMSTQRVAADTRCTPPSRPYSSMCRERAVRATSGALLGCCSGVARSPRCRRDRIR